MRRKITIIVGVIVIIVLLVILVLLPFQESNINVSESAPSYFKEKRLSLLGIPSLNSPVTVIFSVSTDTIGWGPNISLEILVPEGIKLINGNLSWRGDIGPEETVNITAVIQAVKTGDFAIIALAGMPLDGEKIDADSLYISVLQNSGKVSENPPVCRGNVFQVMECMRRKSINRP